LVNEYGLIEIHMDCQYTTALLYNKYHDHQLQVQYQKEASTQYQTWDKKYSIQVFNYQP
ncbi:unnamed protein product, partial [Rotaria socialis]